MIDPAHRQVLVVFDADLGEYVMAEDCCTARRPDDSSGEPVICGEDATRVIGDLLVCDEHYERAKAWIRDHSGVDLTDEIDRMRVLHEERMRLDRERAGQARELGRENSKHRAKLKHQEAAVQIKLDRERLKAEEVARAETSVIYYIRRESDGLVKIGTTRNLPERLATLKREHGPLVLIAVKGGTVTEETALHREFIELRAEGREWFRPELPLLKHMHKTMGEHPVSPDPALPPVMERRVIGSAIRRIHREQAGRLLQEVAADPAA